MAGRVEGKVAFITGGARPGPDEARYVTGVTLPVDAGFTIK